MLFSENLEEIIFHRHELFDSDELIIISGYIGPNPVDRLKTLPLKSTVIYGMYGSEGIRSKLHETLVKLNDSISNINVVYSKVPVHSKCYIWKKGDKIIHALIGSANFSTNGLATPFREILAETTYDTFDPLNTYLTKVMGNSIGCDDLSVVVSTKKPFLSTTNDVDKEVCTMVLFNPTKNEIQAAHGLNWGQGEKAHNDPRASCIPIRAEHIRNYPKLFPPKKEAPTMNVIDGRPHRHNDPIDIIWDDGTTMTGLLEGSQPIKNTPYSEKELKFPKQIASFPDKNVLGDYFRKRLGILVGNKVTMNDLIRYGRTNVEVSLQAEGIYYMDFSANK